MNVEDNRCLKAGEDEMDQPNDDQDHKPQKPAPKKYVSPRLVYLGAVRDLTANASGSINDAGLGMKSSM